MRRLIGQAQKLTLEPAQDNITGADACTQPQPQVKNADLQKK
jgi:hypothetical protein